MNVAQSPNVDPPKREVAVVDGKRGANWNVPHSATSHRDDRDKVHRPWPCVQGLRRRLTRAAAQAGNPCIVYDVVYHPTAIRQALMDARSAARPFLPPRCQAPTAALLAGSRTLW